MSCAYVNCTVSKSAFTGQSPCDKSMERGSWRTLVIKELEHQYSPSHWSPRMDKDAVIESHLREITEGTNKSRSTTQSILNIQYGDRDSEKMDMYLPDGEPTGCLLLVYIHGGYWQFLSKDENGFMVPALVSCGISVMVMDYDIAPRGNMDLIVSQVRRSIAMAVAQCPQITEVYLCGHSAGAHLAAMTLCTDWSEYGVTPNIKGAILVSGVYDLLPITHTYVNDAIKMSQEVALRNSPIQCVTQIKSSPEACHVLIVVAEHDSPEFHRQSQDYFQSLKELGLCVSYKQVDGTDHFDVIERLTQEDYILTQLIRKMILKKCSKLEP